MRHRHAIPIACAAVLCMAGVEADGNPEPPTGWTAATAATATIYSKSLASGSVEFRLHAAVSASEALPAWFARRVHTAPTGIRVDGFGEPKQTDTTAYMVVEKGVRADTGAAVVVMGMGCQTRGGAFRYGELIAPPDMAVINAAAGSAADVMGHACIETQAAAQTAIPAAAAAPAPMPASAPVAVLAPAPASKATAGGLKASQMEAILFSWAQVYEVTGLQLQENAYLLLKDGSYRTQVPKGALDEFDLAADRASHPRNWGSWRREGDKYLLAEVGAAHFHTPEHQSIKLPARAGETLSGSWSAGSGGTIGTTGYWSTTSVTLTADGRFTRNSSGGAGGNSSPGSDANVAVLTVHNDEGSASAVGSGNFGGGGSTRNGSTIANRSGSYRLDGYTMELHYDDGRVVRQLFFTDDDRSFIWFAGAQLARQKPR